MPNREPPSQTELEAMDQFYGMDAAKKGQQLGQPIPGYSGTNRRIDADNLFGMTYAEARNAADQSQSNIDNERATPTRSPALLCPATPAWPTYSEQRNADATE